MPEIETIGPPWAVELVRKDGRLVEVRIKSTGDGELGVGSIQEATQAVVAKLRHLQPRFLGPSAARLRRAYDEADGKMTPDYLAHLAIAYADIAAMTRSVMPALGEAIGKPPATVKGHVLRAREQGYLTHAKHGTQGGEPTDKARRVIKQSSSRDV